MYLQNVEINSLNIYKSAIRIKKAPPFPIEGKPEGLLNI
jgi:hypothetical protein